jgi:hypothetical protein
MPRHFHLKDLHFSIDSAEIIASIMDPYWNKQYNQSHEIQLNWSLDIETRDKTIKGEIWAPHIYHETLHFPIRRWKDLSGQTVSWDSPFDEKTGEANGGFYVFEHEDISQATMIIAQRKGTRFKVQWEGLCNVFWDEDYRENVPFSIETWADFKGILVRGSERDTNETMSEHLSAFIDVADFHQHPIEHSSHKYESGVGMASSRFVPQL